MSRLFIFRGILLVGILPRNILLRGIFLWRDFAGGIFLWRDLEGGNFQRRDFWLEGFSTPANFIGNHVQKKKFAAEFFKNSHQNFSRKSSRRYNSNQLSAVFSTNFAVSVFSLTLDHSFFFGKVGGFKTIRDRAASLTVGDQMLVLGGRDPTGSDLISFEVNLFM